MDAGSREHARLPPHLPTLGLPGLGRLGSLRSPHMVLLSGANGPQTALPSLLGADPLLCLPRVLRSASKGRRPTSETSEQASRVFLRGLAFLSTGPSIGLIPSQLCSWGAVGQAARGTGPGLQEHPALPPHSSGQASGGEPLTRLTPVPASVTRPTEWIYSPLSVQKRRLPGPRLHRPTLEISITSPDLQACPQPLSSW